MPLKVEGRTAVIAVLDQDKGVRVTGPGYTSTLHVAQRVEPKPDPFIVIVVPDSTTRPEAFGRRGVTEKITGLDFDRATVTYPAGTLIGP